MPLRSYHSEMLVVVLFTIIQVLVFTTVLFSSHRAVARMQLAAPTEIATPHLHLLLVL